MQLTNKLVLVTGTTGGIGRALCALLSAAGARLVLNGLVETQLRELQQQLGPQHQIAVADISAMEGREGLEQVCQQAGGVDVVINLAGILDCNLYTNQSEAAISRLMDVNAVAPTSVLAAFTLAPLSSNRRAISRWPF